MADHPIGWSAREWPALFGSNLPRNVRDHFNAQTEDTNEIPQRHRHVHGSIEPGVKGRTL
jgi:hypothetical protein